MATGSDDEFTGSSWRLQATGSGPVEGFDGCSKRFGVMVTILCLCAGNLDLGELSGTDKLFSHSPRASLVELPLGCAVGLSLPGMKVGGITPELSESRTLLLLLLSSENSSTSLLPEVSAL